MDIENEANSDGFPGIGIVGEPLATESSDATDPSHDSMKQMDNIVPSSSDSVEPDELIQDINDAEMIEPPTEESNPAQNPEESKPDDPVPESETAEKGASVTPMEVTEEGPDKTVEQSEQIEDRNEEPAVEVETTTEEQQEEVDKSTEKLPEEVEKTTEDLPQVEEATEELPGEVEKTTELLEVEKTVEKLPIEVEQTTEELPGEIEKSAKDNDDEENLQTTESKKVDSDLQIEAEKDVDDNPEDDDKNATDAASSKDAFSKKTDNHSQAEMEEESSAQPESEAVVVPDSGAKEPEDGSQKDKVAKEMEKDKGDAANNIEYVEMDESMETEDNERSEFVSVNLEKDDGDNKEHAEQNNTDTLGEHSTNTEDDPMFVGVTSDKDDHDKESGNKDDILMEEDPIAADDHQPIDDNEDQEGADEELCIIPDTERVISQEEKDAAAAMTPLKDISEAAAVAAATNDSCAALGLGTSTEPNEDTSANANKFVVSKCNTEELKTCIQCVLQRKVKYTISKENTAQYICSDTCLDSFKESNVNNYILNWEAEIRVKDFSMNMSISPQSKVAFERKCVVCKKKTDDEEQNLTWEIMDFCNEFCLTKYQKEIGSICANCFTDVRPNSLGKYCVRFGNDIRQFCTSHCLEEYKKGLKVCSYCQQDMSKGTDGGFLAPVGDKGQFKDFCSQQCMEKYDIMTNNRPPKAPEGSKCSVCKQENQLTIEYESDGLPNYFCNERCFVAFTFVNNIQPSKCSLCRRYYPNEVLEKNTMFYDNVQYSFCSNSCQNIYIIAHRKIVPCVWCKVKKYNFDMIRRYFKTGPVLNMCSINCLSLFQVSVNAVHSKKTVCNFCNKRHQPMYHLTMSDATIRNFCSYMCVMSFQNKFKKSPITLNNEEYPVPAGEPKKSRKYNDPPALPISKPTSPTLPVISNVQSLAQSKNGGYTPAVVQNSTPRATGRGAKAAPAPPQHVVNSTTVETKVQVKHHIIIKPPKLPELKNAFTSCRVKTHNKATTMKPIMHDKGIQTDEREAQKVIIPVPVPIYIPSPLPMYTTPVPYPLPFPIPIPIPIFIPTTRNSAKGIMKEIKKIQVKIPTDPYEAELLMMAEMVAGDKKEENHTDSESDVDDAGAPDDGGSFSPEPVDASNTFGDDMLQMALKMATELEEPAVDLEGALTASTITAPQGSEAPAEEAAVDDPQPMMGIGERQPYKGRKRSGRGGKQQTPKRRRLSQPVDIPALPAQPAPPPEPAEKPDAHLCLKYTFGVNAWKQWVTTKNAELEKSTKFSKPFKTEILQLTADELNYSLCLFVKEVRKPNGAEYAPDTIYYLCLGIQQYLFENGRIDNIFCDPYYEQFTDSLDEVARKFSVLYNDSHYIVTRVEEEHLWESKQLGAHSPHVLLSTLMFFNTKHFNLTTVQEHMQLSFSHIMKHWKRNPNQAGVARTPGSRNVLLRFYPPQAANQNNTRKKKVYEQQENDENPLRCPVKLYEFYLSKCPESVKTRNDVFYLQPERSCVPDSPVWYSTSALAQENLEKMLHRVKMVKEINVALLTS